MSKKSLRAAGATGVATLISRILGLVREQVFAILFGAGNIMDAFQIAYRIPNLLRDLFAEGAMSAALVPTFVRVREEQGQRRAWRVAGLVFRVLFITVGFIALVGFLFSESLVQLYASAFQEIPGKFELTVSLTRILFPFFPLVALAAAFMGILNASGAFFIPAFGAALFNLTIIVFGGLLTVWAPHWGWEPIEGMAMGVVAGGLVQAFCQLPLLYRKGYRWQKKTKRDPAWHQDPALRTMLALMVPGTLGLAATQINILVNSILATSEGTGAVSWLNYAFRFMMFPIGVFGVSLAVGTLPEVSEFWVKRKWQDAASATQRALRRVFAINLPAAVGLGVLAFPIIQLIYQYGKFTEQDALATSHALMAYCVGLVTYSGIKVLVPICYSVGRVRIAVVSSVISVFLNFLFNLFFVRIFGYWGLALGVSLTSILNFGFVLWALHRTFREKSADLGLGALLRSGLTQVGLAGTMGVAVYWSFQFLQTSDVISFGAGTLAQIIERGMKVLFLTAEGVLLVILLAGLLKIKDTNEVIEFFGRQLKKRLT